MIDLGIKNISLEDVSSFPYVNGRQLVYKYPTLFNIPELLFPFIISFIEGSVCIDAIEPMIISG